MDGSRRSSSSVNFSTVAKPAASDFQRSNRYERKIIPEEIKENDQQLHRGAALGATGLKKEYASFMSTTIAAASKKKILTEKNGAPSSECSGTYSAGYPEIKRSSLVYDPQDSAPHVASFPANNLHRSREETLVSSGSQPYDPLTNYLSPRPKFLRYDPNRRREIFLRRERGLKEAEGRSNGGSSNEGDAEGSSNEGDASDSPAASPSLKQEMSDVWSLKDKESHENLDGEDDYDSVDEEEEEDAKERPSFFNLVWKSLFLFWVFLFSTCYISSVRPPSTASSLQNVCSPKANLSTTRDSLQEVVEDVGVSLYNYVGTCMNMSSHDQCELKNWGNGISSNLLDGLPKNSENFEGGELQDEGNVKPNINLVMVDGKSDERRQELEDDSEKIIAEGSDLAIDSIPVMAQGEIEEFQIVKVEDVYLIEGENEGSFSTVLDHEDGFGGAATFEDHEEDVTMEAEIEETNDVTEKLSKTAQSIQEESVSDLEEEGPLSFDQRMNFENKWEKEPIPALPQDSPYPTSFPDTMEDADTLRFYRIEVFTTILVLIVSACTIVGFLRFWETSPSDNGSSAPLPNSGLADEGRSNSQLANEGFNFHVSTDRCEELCEDHLPAIKLPEEKLVGSFVKTDKCTELYERNPPTVKLLGEFCVAEQGIPKAEYAHLRRKKIRTEAITISRSERKQSPSQETTVMKKSMHPPEEANQLPSNFLSAESSPYATPGQEKIGRKQNNGRGHETIKVVSTPVRRSSRIRERVVSPGA